MDLERLKWYCDRDNLRISAPWEDDDFGERVVCASDGRLLLVVKDCPPLKTHPEKHPSLKKIVQELSGNYDRGMFYWVPWALFERHFTWQEVYQPTYCKTCAGKGRMFTWTDCSVCKGSGTHWCEQCEEDHDCGKCQGEGQIKRYTPTVCITCDGAGKAMYGDFVETPLGYFNGTLLHTLRQFPAMAVRLIVNDTNFPNSALAYRFEGGWGFLMPLKVTGEDEVTRMAAAHKQLISELEGDTEHGPFTPDVDVVGGLEQPGTAGVGVGGAGGIDPGIADLDAAFGDGVDG